LRVDDSSKDDKTSTEENIAACEKTSSVYDNRIVAKFQDALLHIFRTFFFVALDCSDFFG